MFARRRDLLEREADRLGALAVRGDLTVPTDLRGSSTRPWTRSAAIDVLVNNGGGPPPGPAAGSTDEAIESAVELLLLSAIRLTNLCLPHLEASGRGRIVNIESSSVRSPIDGLALSNAVRPGLVGWMKTLAREVGPKGITVNTICPGRIDTERLRSLADAGRSLADPARAPRRAGRDRLRRHLPGLRPRGLRHRGGRAGRRRRHPQFALKSGDSPPPACSSGRAPSCSSSRRRSSGSSRPTTTSSFPTRRSRSPRSSPVKGGKDPTGPGRRLLRRGHRPPRATLRAALPLRPRGRDARRTRISSTRRA